MINLKIKNNQNGRSMIEMLGVLAIIGVLSVGGIAGYSKAMMKYRINKTIEQITLIAGNIRSFFAPQNSYSGLDGSKNGYNIIKKAKLVPEEMWGKRISESEGEYDITYSVWGDEFQIVAWGTEKKLFYINLAGSMPVEACIDLATQDWATSAGGTVAVAIGTNADIEDITTNKCAGTKSNDKVIACKKGTTLALPIPMDEAIKICEKCESFCDFGIMFE